MVPVHGAGIAEGRAYLVMRYVSGDDLRTLVRRDGACSPRQAAEVAEQLGAALDAIHRAGYVHRDVKPQNVMIGADGHVYLSDFGLAKEALATSGPTTSEHWVGTLDYVAPEQIRGERVGPRADVYALGGVLCFMLTGRGAVRPADRRGEALGAPARCAARAVRARPRAAAGVRRRRGAGDGQDPRRARPPPATSAGAARDAAEGRAPRPTVTARLPPATAGRLRRRAPWRAVAALGLLAAAGVLAIVLLGGAATSRSGPCRPTKRPRRRPRRPPRARAASTRSASGRARLSSRAAPCGS